MIAFMTRPGAYSTSATGAILHHLVSSAKRFGMTMLAIVQPVPTIA
jgi:hypothetical protein